MVRDNLNQKIDVDWSSPRVLCIAEEFNKYDTYAVEQMKRPIELIKYRIFEDDLFALNILTAAKDSGSTQITKNKDYKVENHLKKADSKIKELYKELSEYALDLGSEVIESPRKLYIAFRVIRNFMCVQVYNHHLHLYLRLNPEEINLEADILRDVSNIAHYGTGDLEVRVESEDDIELAKELIEKAYDNSGS